MIPPVNGIGHLRSFKAIVRPAKSTFQNQTAQLAHAAERHRRAGAGAWGSSVEPSVPRFGLGDGIIPQGLEVGADGIVVEGLPNALHGEKSFGLAVPGRCFADLSCEITKLLLNFTNYTGCG